MDKLGCHPDTNVRSTRCWKKEYSKGARRWRERGVDGSRMREIIEPLSQRESRESRESSGSVRLFVSSV